MRYGREEKKREEGDICVKLMEKVPTSLRLSMRSVTPKTVKVVLLFCFVDERTQKE